MIYKRSCPQCKKEIEYKNPRSFKWAERDAKRCRKCYSQSVSNTLKIKVSNGDWTPYIRNSVIEKKQTKKFNKKCSNCGNDMFYNSLKGLKKSEYSKTVCNSCSAKINKKGLINGLSDTSIKQMRASKAGFSNWEEYVQNYPKKQFYKREVWKYTYKNNLEDLPNWDKRGRCGVQGAYQLDHIVSINTGWENNISAEEIANIKNIRMITWEENRKKGKS
jgi:hypothetical protein